MVRVLGLENSKRQRGHYTFGLFSGATDLMQMLCSGGCWRGAPYGLRNLSELRELLLPLSAPARRAKVRFGWYVGA